MSVAVSVAAVLAGAAAVEAASPVVRVENRSATPIRDLFVKKAGEREWGSNLIEGDSIAAGASRRVEVTEDGGCRYDVLVVFEDGRSEGNDGVDLCQREAYIVEPPAEGQGSEPNR
ncbi:MAG: hypothetical protein ACM30I_00205 [Gemmatimonas sp.]